MGLKILHNGQVIDFSDSKYNPGGYGSKRLNVRAGGGIIQYGLATSASQASDKRVKFNVGGVVHYIGTSSALSSASNYTSYSTYSTFTYTSGEPKSSVLTRQATTTTTNRTQPARYIYRASYYTGKTSGYTVMTSSHYSTASMLLSSTRSSGYTTYYNTLGETTRASTMTVTHQARGSKSSFANGSTKYTYSEIVGTTYISNAGTSPTAIAAGSTVDTWTGGGYTGTYAARTNTAGATVRATYDATHGFRRTRRNGCTAVTSNRALTIYTSPPGYYTWQGWQARTGVATGTMTVVASNYSSKSTFALQSGGHQQNYSFWTRYNYYDTHPNISQTGPSGTGTLTSTATPIGGIPGGWTISSGPSIISSTQSYTYTDAGCTKTYASNYSTSYWTVTHTLTSNQPVRTSQGSTATTRVSYYTDHNFV